MKVAIFHPWIKSKGGAERVVLEIAKALKADVYTWVYLKEKTFEEFKKLRVIEVGPKILKFDPNSFIKRGLYIITSLFTKINNIWRYDTFIISTSGIAEFILLRNKNKNTIAYVHTPLRAAYDLFNYYYKKFGFPKKFIFSILVKLYSNFDRLIFKKFKFVIANSNETKRRLMYFKLYNGKVYVIYPGVRIIKNYKIKFEKFFFYPSRYSELKRQDLVIRAFNKFSKKIKDYKLVLCGSIRDKNFFSKLKKLANNNSNVIILKGISERELNNLYRRCFMVLYFPINEDFGIVPLEAMAYGKSVIAADEGGYKEIVSKGYNFLIKPKERDIIKTMLYCVRNREKIIKNSKLNMQTIKEYSWKNFISKFKRVIKNEISTDVI